MRNQVQLFETDLLLDADLATNLTSEPEPIVNYPHARAISNFSIQITWDGSSVEFSLNVEASNDGVNYTPIECAASTIDTDSGTLILNFYEQTFSFIRLTTTATAGTGTVSAKFLGWSRFI